MKSPLYLDAFKNNILEERINLLYEILKNCRLCPRKCGVNRFKKEEGYCKSTDELVVSSYFPHFGEEDVLVGRYGSGTIFFSNCNLLCVYCQNYDISHLGYGKKIDEYELGLIMIKLQSMGCHNINLVTPTHYTPQIIKALYYAIQEGLKIPIVYNCSGYESLDTLKLLDGIIDIYMPDFKYGDIEEGKLYSNSPDYFDICKEAIKEMYRQVGDLKVDNNGLAYQGLLIRHLVLPESLESSKKILDFICNEISKDSYVNIMIQYRPCFKANKYPKISRRITLQEYDDVVNYAKSIGLYRGF